MVLLGLAPQKYNALILGRYTPNLEKLSVSNYKIFQNAVYRGVTTSRKKIRFNLQLLHLFSVFYKLNSNLIRNKIEQFNSHLKLKLDDSGLR